MVQELFGKIQSFRRNARVIKRHAPKLWAGTAIALIATTSIIGTNFNPNRTNAQAMNDVANPESVVVCAYAGFLSRAPEPTGKTFWISEYKKSGHNAVKLGNNFYNSKEGQKFENRINFEAFIQRTYKSCLKRSASAAEVKLWSNHHLQGISRAQIFAFIVKAGDKPWTLTAEAACKAYTKGGSVKPTCKSSTAGTHLNVVTATVPGSNIVVNKAWLANVNNVRQAALKAKFNLQAYQDPKVPYPAGSYRSETTQQWLRSHGYPAAKGVSMHQWGLAIDISCNGIPLNRNAACLSWMRSNAPRYGLYQLPSEAWHWSSNGR